MGRPLRWFMPNVVYEVSIRTIQERFLLRPGQASRALILGVIGRALALFPEMRLYAFAYLSNHAHLMLSSSNGATMVAFMSYINGNVARELGRLHGWRGPFWGRRYRAIPILDDDALVARLKYLLANGVKEGLVARPEDWPGASSTPGLLGQRLRGQWVYRALESRALRSKKPVDPSTYSIEYDVELSPLPCWRGLSEEERIQKVRRLIAEVVAERQATGLKPRGVRSVLSNDPHGRPTDPGHSPAPLCHTTSTTLREAFVAHYRFFVDSFRRGAAVASSALARFAEHFPSGSFPKAVAYPSGTPPGVPDLSSVTLTATSAGIG